MRGDGRLYQRGRVWWVAWSFRGRERRESSKSRDKAVAKRLLRIRVGQIAKGERPSLGDHQVSVGQILDHYAADRENAGRWSSATRRSAAWVRARFGDWKVTEITLATLTPWCADMRKRYASGSLRVHLATLKAALTSARRAGLIEHRADFPILAPGAPRKGYYRPAEALAHLAAFTDRDVADLAQFLYLAGWRLNEGRQLVWPEVDRAGGVIVLSAERSKSREGRVLPLVGAMAALLERRWKARRLGCPYVFHVTGKPVTEYRFRSRFQAALGAAGLEKRLPHDMRRAMSRDQIRAGVSKAVAMSVTGHKDPRMFDRYNVTVLSDQTAALLATEAYRAQAAKSDNLSDSRGANA